MVRNYLRILYRNFIRNKFYTLFNLIGLTTGLTAALFILFYIQDELSYDRHFKNFERIYRLESTFIVNGNPDLYATFPIPLGPALKEEIPEIEEVARIHFIDESIFKYKEKQFYEWDFVYADSTLFRLFSHEFIRGNPDKALTEPHSIVLTESTALRYFGDEDPYGKILTDGNNQSYRVTGIIKDIPANTHLKYDAMISMSTLPEVYNTTKPSRFWRVILYTYILVHENTSIEDVQRKFLDFYTREMEPLGKKFNVSFELMTTPLKDTHFRQGLIAEQPSGNISYLIIFSVIAVFILLIAAINYMNMSTARSAARAKEVGVRKVLGADKRQLVKQFLGESISLSVLALAIATFLVGLFIGYFNEFTGKEISFSLSDNYEVFAGIFVLTLFIGFLSGSYPAFYLSSFQPVMVLKGNLSHTGKGNQKLRRLLVGIQFFIAVFMVISSLIVSGQLRFLKEKDLGYNEKNMVMLQSKDPVLKQKFKSFKNEILRNPSVEAATNSEGIPTYLRWIKSMKIEQEEGMQERSVLYLEADYDFCKTYGFDIIEGRDFDRNMGTDSLQAVLINETAAMTFGWASDPIGKKIHYGYGQDGTGGRMMKVIGVVKDFHFSSLHNAIEPLIIFIQEVPGELMSIRIKEENKEATLKYLEKKWHDFGASVPFHYEFIEDRMSDSYSSDQKTGVIIQFGTILAIILALLGLLGLSSYVTEQRTREVGLRKILGASVGNILFHLYRDFIGLFILAYLLAAPIAWWRLNLWLESEFVYVASVHWTLYLYAGIFCLLIGFGAVSFNIIRTALGNPIRAIKYE